MNIRKIDLNLLYALLILLEERNVSRSAARMHLTQPTVSNMLAKLRALLHDPLFTRTRHGLLPTSRALALEPELRQIFSSVDAILAPGSFDPQTCDQTVILSSNDYMQYTLLAPALLEMRSRAPLLKFAVRQAEIADIVPMMEKGAIDIAVTIPEFSDARLRSQLLYTERYVVAMRREHPLSGKKLTMKAFLGMEHAIVSPTAGQFWGATDDALKKLGLSRRVSLSVSSFFTLIEVVATSDYIALIPERLSIQFLDRLSIAEPPLQVAGFEVISVWSNTTHLDPTRQWVRAELLRVAGRRR
ncbi:MAG: LysR family transcriptional regulator [Halieaceae bacterium]|nr:LysR family transcriptional regulator [Halieaceae bacterium]